MDRLNEYIEQHPHNRVSAKVLQYTIDADRAYAAFVEGYSAIAQPKMVEKMRSPVSTFNVFALLLGPFYCMYRRLYSIGWIWLIAALFAFDSVLIWLNVVAYVACGFAFYPLYRRRADKVIEYCARSGMTQGQTIAYMKEKGGTNISMPVATALIICGVVCTALGIALFAVYGWMIG